MKGKSALDFPLEWPAVLLSRKRYTLIRRLNDEIINACGQSLKQFFTGFKTAEVTSDLDEKTL